MQEGQLLMTQADRDRLVTLRKAKKRLITQRQAAEELDLSVRQVKRLLYGLKKHGDKSVGHGLRGIFAQEARDNGKQRNRAAVDDLGEVMARRGTESESGAHLAASPEP